MRNSVASHLGNRAIHLIDGATQRMYRLTRGRIGHQQMGWTFLLLTTVGRMTGRLRTHTLVYLPYGDDLLIVASNNGGAKHPAWYLNLTAQPQVQVRFGSRQGEFLARTASPEERAALWPQLLAYHAPFAHHQEQTSREIPVVLLSPLTKATDGAALAAGRSNAG
jgi:deazaflavin-dependent oxidoreductase (nitroreductase family)